MEFNRIEQWHDNFSQSNRLEQINSLKQCHDNFLQRLLITNTLEDNDLIIRITIEACDAIWNTIPQKDLAEGLVKEINRFDFYNLIELYLAWLKCNIKYDHRMPVSIIKLEELKNIPLNIVLDIVLDIVRYIRDYKIKSFLLPDEAHESIIQYYLDYLIGDLENFSKAH
ncbi:hypothetical protein F7734_49185 [Scytonema sp. UIC 10036]|uniref:hypothetical protein n=1 Tax=Scytonema sp. UIC 10036 TaxID=2304196 RepID=UPI0012DAA065|nr:hypothetical protein [Scytonema sp. UIC 10036]MUG99830.1 hypothetical protein [Scytonema sp. UIC 10036]